MFGMPSSQEVSWMRAVVQWAIAAIQEIAKQTGIKIDPCPQIENYK